MSKKVAKKTTKRVAHRDADEAVSTRYRVKILSPIFGDELDNRIADFIDDDSYVFHHVLPEGGDRFTILLVRRRLGGV